MRYSAGSIGRIFIIRLDHDDDIISSIKDVVLREGIAFAQVMLIGALSKAEIVAGPHRLTVPPLPDRMSLDDGREIVGLGSAIDTDSGIKVHIHSSFGKKGSTSTGCLRGKSSVFVTVEILLMEITGVDVSRRVDSYTQCELLSFREHQR